MKLIKRLVSVVCALGLMATMTSVLVAQAATENAMTKAAPTMKVEVIEGSYNETAKTGRMRVSLVGMDTVADDTSTLFVNMIQVGVKLPEDVFDTSLYATTGFVTAFSQNVSLANGYFADKVGITGPKYANGVMAVTFAQANASVSDLTAGVSPCPVMGKEIANIPILEFNFKLNDNVDSTKVEYGDVQVVGTTATSDASAIADVSKWSNVAGDFLPITLEAPTIGTPAGGDDEGDDDTNAPVQVGGGVIEDTVGDSKDAAVAYTQKFTAVEGYKVRWNLTCNKVGEPDKMINGSYTYTIANIETEGDVNIGLIVQYDPSVYENVVVTDGAIVTE